MTHEGWISPWWFSMGFPNNYEVLNHHLLQLYIYIVIFIILLLSVFSLLSLSTFSMCQALGSFAPLVPFSFRFFGAFGGSVWILWFSPWSSSDGNHHWLVIGSKKKLRSCMTFFTHLWQLSYWAMLWGFGWVSEYTRWFLETTEFTPIKSGLPSIFGPFRVRWPLELVMGVIKLSNFGVYGIRWFTMVYDGIRYYTILYDIIRWYMGVCMIVYGTSIPTTVERPLKPRATNEALCTHPSNKCL